MKSRANPMHRLLQANQAPRCSAMSKRSRCRCRAPAMKGRSVCRMHGARAGAPTGMRNGAWRHGLATKDAVARRRKVLGLVREVRANMRRMEGNE